MFYWLQKNLPKIVIAPSFAVILWFVYGFVLWTFQNGVEEPDKVQQQSGFQTH